jgi:hypothetical protein
MSIVDNTHRLNEVKMPPKQHSHGAGGIDMLKDDHEKVEGLFEQFESTEGQEHADIAATAIIWDSRSMPEPCVVRMWLAKAQADELDPQRIYDAAVKIRPSHWDPAPPFEAVMRFRDGGGIQ